MENNFINCILLAKMTRAIWDLRMTRIDGFLVQDQFIGYWDGSQWQRVPLDEPLYRANLGASKSRDGGVWILHLNRLWKWQNSRLNPQLKLDSKYFGFVEHV